MKVTVEHYVSAKVAKLAKEKGFNLVTKHHYQGRQFIFVRRGHQDWNGLGKSYIYTQHHLKLHYKSGYEKSWEYLLR